MKVLIPACNMESRLRNKYGFFLQNWLIFGPFCGCVPGGVGWSVRTPVCGRCGCSQGCSLWGCVCVSYICTPRACVRAPMEVARVPARHRGSVYRPLPLAYVQLWPCGRAHLAARVCLRGSGSTLLRSPPPAGLAPSCALDPRGTRAPVPCVFACASVAPRVCGRVLGSAWLQPSMPCSCAERHVCAHRMCERAAGYARVCSAALGVCGGVCVFLWTNFAQMKPFSSTFNRKSIAPSL